VPQKTFKDAHMNFRLAISIVTAICACIATAQEQPAPSQPATSPQASTVPASPAVPDELDGIKNLLDKEKEVVDAAYAFQRVQLGLANWDERMAREIALKGGEQNEKDAQAKLDAAHHRRELVAKAWTMIHEKYQENPRVMSYYGVVLYFDLGRPDEALMLWNKAMALDEKLPDPVNELMIHHFHSGDYDNGWRMLEKVQKLAPNSADVLFNIAQIYFTYHDQACKRYKWKPERVYKEAMKLTKKATEIEPNDFELLQDYANSFNAAENFQVEADWNESAEYWKKARQFAPDAHSVYFTWLNEARSAIRAGDRARAEACLAETLKLDPKSKAANMLMSSLDSQIAKHQNKKKKD
jgi:tetratricopeptide (TPR) repeat protein